MAERLRAWVRGHWPRLRLRTIVFATLFAVAALPGVGALFLRVYENTLVRQTEAELAAQGAALAAAAAASWPAAVPGASTRRARVDVPDGAAGPASTLDLSTTPIRPERPAPWPSAPPAVDAVEAGRRLAPVLRDTRGATLASLILLDRDGRIVVGSAARGSLARLPEVATALAGRPETVLRRNGAYRAVYPFEWLSRAAAIRVHHARPILVDGRVVGVLLLSRSARALFRGLYEDRGKIALGIGIILVLLVVLSGLLSRGVTRPIERLSAATRAVAGGSGSVPAPPDTAAIEIQQLYADFAVMAAAIERRSRYLRDVAHAISHEFKTPLAGIRGAVELLQDHGDEMSGEERDRFLANAAADARRLTALIARLLDLARADMTRADPHATTALPRLLAPLVDAHGGVGFAVSADMTRELPDVAIPAAVLETIVATLIDNSRRAGASRVTVTAAVEAKGLLLCVADDGAGIAAADTERVFDPFFTTRREDGGTGLGLTIARSLLDAHGGAIRFVATGRGALVELVLPVA